ncbi:UNVERIFIED_CONTAM: hypothetical protein NCL1_36177 [Trichonephila clavipes]
MLSVLFLGASLVFALYAFLYLKHKALMKKFKNIPGIAPVTVFGNLYEVAMIYSKKLQHHPGVYILQGVLGTNSLFYKEGIQLIWMGTFPIVSILKPELLEQCRPLYYNGVPMETWRNSGDTAKLESFLATKFGQNFTGEIYNVPIYDVSGFFEKALEGLVGGLHRQIVLGAPIQINSNFYDPFLLTIPYI